MIRSLTSLVLMAIVSGPLIAADAVTVNPAGKVGINNDAPTQQLDVVGDTKIQGNLTVTGSITGVGGIGGSGVDGAAVDGTTPTNPGFYEYESLTWTSTRTLPWFTVIRVRGDASITGAVTVGKAPRAGGYLITDVGTSSTSSGILQNDPLVDWPYHDSVQRGRRGKQGSGNRGSGGGGGMGTGGTGQSGAVGGIGLKYNAFSRLWVEMTKRPLIGGEGGDDGTALLAGRGGGALVLFVQGNLTIGANLRADGESPLSNAYAAGGGGGTILIVCTGTITYSNSPTIGAKGGSGWTTGAEDGGNGGAGYVGLVAPTHAGAVTMDVPANTDGAGTDSEVGVSEQVTLSGTYINALLVR